MSPDHAEGTGEGAGPKAARELLIDRQLPRFDAHSFSAPTWMWIPGRSTARPGPSIPIRSPHLSRSCG